MTFIYDVRYIVICTILWHLFNIDINHIYIYYVTMIYVLKKFGFNWIDKSWHKTSQNTGLVLSSKLINCSVYNSVLHATSCAYYMQMWHSTLISFFIFPGFRGERLPFFYFSRVQLIGDAYHSSMYCCRYYILLQKSKLLCTNAFAFALNALSSVV